MGGGGVKGFSPVQGIVREKGTLAPLAPLASPKWTRWPKMLAYCTLHTTGDSLAPKRFSQRQLRCPLE